MKSAGMSAVLRLEVAPDCEAMSRQAAGLILEELKRKPDLLLCASAGGTPTRTYELLGQQAASQPGLFSQMRVLQIDEWSGLEAGHPATCEQDLRTKLLEPLRIGNDRFVGFKTHATAARNECERIAGWLARNGPIDVCILGLGLNGHVAMNEPGEWLTPHAHVARLTRSSLQHPMLKHSRKKPRCGLTIGMADILSSRQVMLLVSGRHKREAMKCLLKPEVYTRFPASFLWLHPQAVVLCDCDAAPANYKSLSRQN